MSILAKWNDFFFSKSLSLFDWFGISMISAMARDSLWWFLLLIPFIPISYHLSKRFTIN